MVQPNQEALEILHEKREALDRLRQGLLFTESRLMWPMTNTESCDAETLEKLSAFTERFAKLQDVLAGAMRHSIILQGENPLTFTDVLAVMEKLGIVEDQQEWINIRLLRNKAAHDYTTDGERQAEYFNTLHAQLPALLGMTEKFLAWSSVKTDPF
ncbi:MAG: hypothetical protein A2Z99_14345 [Treponema sp. GWB1_62_6]|nr:MAG: hypothetical protein A2Z99_14345 [Treponema sp. GWB1_62_6]OHE69022.1 MAG: hypothetical protein A2413_04490 [Treponema sp. RIFOXYC1_FULL_61_9]HCM25610.1 hypothetical protein [Treponema sp.]